VRWVLAKMQQQAGQPRQQRQQQGPTGAAAPGVMLQLGPLQVPLGQRHGLLQGLPLLLLLVLELVQLQGRAAWRCRVEALQGSTRALQTLLLLLPQQQMQGGPWHLLLHLLCLSLWQCPRQGLSVVAALAHLPLSQR
jgi:hypothetical protein